MIQRKTIKIVFLEFTLLDPYKSNTDCIVLCVVYVKVFSRRIPMYDVIIILYITTCSNQRSLVSESVVSVHITITGFIIHPL